MTTTPAPSRRGPILVIALIALLAVAGGGLWYLFLRPAGPAPVSLGSAAPATAAPTAAASPEAGATDDAASDAPTAPGASPGTGGGDGIAGSWTVDPAIGSFDDFSGSFVGYRVKETLASIGATEAVGRTPDVTGTVTIEGTTITAAELTADLTGLKSDDDRRDGQLRRQALETGQFPTATFKLTAPVDLGSVPAEGATVDVTVTGDLTLHGVTRPVQIPLQARLAGGVVTIAGSLPIAFADYSITPPSSMIVLSVEDKGVMELQLQLSRG
ncbi:MAG TPA: YceI family protein [Candidatus Limnocylindrales bacterium]|nr:YceI family protein [Candidatus Limnocylindrales bacterium]